MISHMVLTAYVFYLNLDAKDSISKIQSRVDTFKNKVYINQYAQNILNVLEPLNKTNSPPPVASIYTLKTFKCSKLCK